MSKKPAAQEEFNLEESLEESLEGLEVEIIRHTMDDLGVNVELSNFVESRDRGDEIAQGSFAEYIKEKHYAVRNAVVVPDLSGHHIENTGDLIGVDPIDEVLEEVTEVGRGVREGFVGLEFLEFCWWSHMC